MATSPAVLAGPRGGGSGRKPAEPSRNFVFTMSEAKTTASSYESNTFPRRRLKAPLMSALCLGTSKHEDNVEASKPTDFNAEVKSSLSQRPFVARRRTSLDQVLSRKTTSHDQQAEVALNRKVILDHHSHSLDRRLKPASHDEPAAVAASLWDNHNRRSPDRGCSSLETLTINKSSGENSLTSSLGRHGGRKNCAGSSDQGSNSRHPAAALAPILPAPLSVILSASARRCQDHIEVPGEGQLEELLRSMEDVGPATAAPPGNETGAGTSSYKHRSLSSASCGEIPLKRSSYSPSVSSLESYNHQRSSSGRNISPLILLPESSSGTMSPPSSAKSESSASGGERRDRFVFRTKSDVQNNNEILNGSIVRSVASEVKVSDKALANSKQTGYCDRETSSKCDNTDITDGNKDTPHINIDSSNKNRHLQQKNDHLMTVNTKHIGLTDNLVHKNDVIHKNIADKSCDNKGEASMSRVIDEQWINAAPISTDTKHEAEVDILEADTGALPADRATGDGKAGMVPQIGDNVGTTKASDSGSVDGGLIKATDRAHDNESRTVHEVNDLRGANTGSDVFGSRLDNDDELDCLDGQNMGGDGQKVAKDRQKVEETHGQLPFGKPKSVNSAKVLDAGLRVILEDVDHALREKEREMSNQSLCSNQSLTNFHNSTDTQSKLFEGHLTSPKGDVRSHEHNPSSSLGCASPVEGHHEHSIVFSEKHEARLKSSSRTMDKKLQNRQKSHSSSSTTTSGKPRDISSKDGSTEVVSSHVINFHKPYSKYRTAHEKTTYSAIMESDRITEHSGIRKQNLDDNLISNTTENCASKGLNDEIELNSVKNEPIYAKIIKKKASVNSSTVDNTGIVYGDKTCDTNLDANRIMYPPMTNDSSIRTDGLGHISSRNSGSSRIDNIAGQSSGSRDNFGICDNSRNSDIVESNSDITKKGCNIESSGIQDSHGSPHRRIKTNGALCRPMRPYYVSNQKRADHSTCDTGCGTDPARDPGGGDVGGGGQQMVLRTATITTITTEYIHQDESVEESPIPMAEEGARPGMPMAPLDRSAVPHIALPPPPLWEDDDLAMDGVSPLSPGIPRRPIELLLPPPPIGEIPPSFPSTMPFVIPSREQRRVSSRPGMPAISEDCVSLSSSSSSSSSSESLPTKYMHSTQNATRPSPAANTDDAHHVSHRHKHEETRSRSRRVNIRESRSKSGHELAMTSRSSPCHELENSRSHSGHDLSSSGHDPGSSESPRSLLDSMHKKYYPGQYQMEGRGRSRAHSAEAACRRRPKETTNISADSQGDGSTGRNSRAGGRTRGRSESPRGERRRKGQSSSLDHYAEIEAIEACKWLRAAGFPQYAQMYEEHQFPIEISSVEKDHDFLDEDSIQSLFRRLTTLNKCATMKIEAPHRKSTDDSDEEEQCALSDKWRYQRSSRRWSRRDLDNRDLLGNTISYTIGGQSRPIRSSSSHDSVITDDIDDSLSPNDESPVFKSRADHGQVSDSDISQASSSGPLSPASLRRSASERFKGASKSFLTRMQSLKAGKKKHPTTTTAATKFPPNKMLEISGPVVIEQEEMRQRMDRLGCVDISPTSEGASSLHPALSSSDSGTSGHSLPHTSRTPLTDPTPRRYMGRHSPTQDSIPTSHKKVNQSVIHSETHPTSQSYSKAELVASGRLSTYDNLDDDPAGAPTKSDPQSELDIILRDLYENISGLNRTLGDSDDIDSEKTTNIPSASTTSSTTSSSTNKAPTTNSGSNCINQVTDNNSSSPVEQASSKQDKNLASSSSTNWSDSTTTSVNGITTTTSNSSSMWTESSTTTTSTYTSESTTRGTQRGENGSGSGYNHPTRSDRSENGAESRLNHGEKRDVNHPSAGISDNPSLGAGMSALDSSQMDLVDIELLDQMVTHKQDSNSTRADTPPSGSSSAAESNHEDEPEPDSGGGGGGGGSRERRDSGVGSSLTRAPSDRRRHRIRWHSFMKSHRPSLSSRNLQISSMSAGQMMVLRRLCLLKVTALMEKFSPSSKSGWNWVMPKFMKRFKSPDYSDKNVFGVPLQVILQRTGQPLPQCILYAMRCLRRTAQDAVGIFRKSGVKSRIQKLRNEVETSPESVDFESLQPYDVADLLKQYFRELPECLLTNKLSESFINIFTHVPADMRLEALQATVMLLPDENCEVLQSLLLFLGDMAQHAQHNQMTASNLAVCFAPSLFHMCGSGPSYPGTTASPKRGRKAGSGGGLAAGIPDARELMEQKAAHECLTRMITDCKKIFMVPEEMLSKFRFSYMEQGDPVPLCELGRSRGTDGELQTSGSGSGAGAPGDYRAHMELCIQGLLKEARDRFKGWVTVSAGGAAGGATELAYRKVGDGHPLRLWKTTVDVEAPPVEVLSRLLHQRHLWDEDLLKWRVVEKLDAQTDVFQYVVNTMAPHPTRDYCELRAWRSDLPPRGACVLVSTSVEHEAASLLGGIRGVILASRYLIEPGGAGRSRLTHIARVDIRGHSVEWYNKVYGHLCANQMRRIRDSFQRTISNTDGPETKI